VAVLGGPGAVARFNTELKVPECVVLRAMLRAFGRSWVVSGRSWGGLGPVLGLNMELNVSLRGRSWNLLGQLWGGLGTVWVLNMELNVPDCAMLRTMLRALGRSWAGLRPSWGGLGVVSVCL